MNSKNQMNVPNWLIIVTFIVLFASGITIGIHIGISYEQNRNYNFYHHAAGAVIGGIKK